MMKRQENKQRFYLWDYLWWIGEKWKQARRTGRVDGEMMLSIYIFALLIFPMMTVTIRLFQVCRHCCHVSFLALSHLPLCRSSAGFTNGEAKQ